MHEGVWWAWQGLRGWGDKLLEGAVHVTSACCQAVGHLSSGPATGDKSKEWGVSRPTQRALVAATGRQKPRSPPSRERAPPSTGTETIPAELPISQRASSKLGKERDFSRFPLGLKYLSRSKSSTFFFFFF